MGDAVGLGNHVFDASRPEIGWRKPQGAPPANSTAYSALIFFGQISILRRHFALEINGGGGAARQENRYREIPR